jgi:tetratricopeptide (TPR) repeat protein
MRAYVEAIGELGDYYHNQYGAGNRDVIAMLKAEEANLLHARRLALSHGWHRRVISAMQGLRSLYGQTGRRTEWRALVAEIVPHFVDPATDGPLPGREAQWSLVTEHRVLLLEEERQWAEAARLQTLRVDYERQRAIPLLALPPERLDAVQRNSLRSLAVSLHELGEIQREQGVAACVASYTESYELSLRIVERTVAASCAFNLGHAYKDLPALRDFDLAERWYRRDLELTPESDRFGRGKTLGQLGSVAYERFDEAREAGQPEAVLTEHLNAALQFYQQKQALDPPDAIDECAITHNQLGNIYRNAGQLDQAVAHYREAIRYDEQAGNLYGAAITRENVAITYANAGRLDDALLFARAALRNFEEFGPAAAAEAAEAQRGIAWIEGLARRK